MSNNFVIPSSQSVSGLLSMIFGEDLVTSICDPAELDKQHIATFIDDSDQLVALCACDKEFVAYSGAALSMIPADVAKDMISGNDVPEAMISNFYEVMNICSKLMMSDSSSHLRLDKTLVPDAAAEVIGAMQGAQNKIGFVVEIPRYGTGTIAFIVS